MKMIRVEFAGFIGLLTIGLLAAAPTLALAQEDAGPAWLNFRIHTVKPDQVAAWESLSQAHS